MKTSLSACIAVLPSLIYAMVAMTIFDSKVPNMLVGAVGIITSPIYLLLRIEEMLGGKKLALIIDERAASLWSEIAAVSAALICLSWAIDTAFLKGSHPTLNRVCCSILVIPFGCLMAYTILWFLK